MTDHNLDERQSQVLSMWNDGRSYGDIGGFLGLTRNAVAGIIHRMQKKGIALRKGSPINPLKPVMPIKHRPPPSLPKVPRETFARPPVPLFLCNPDGCKFAISWDNREHRHLFCNEPSVPNRSFCQRHYDIVYVKQEVRR